MKPKKLSPRIVKAEIAYLKHKREIERERYANALIKIQNEELEVRDRCAHKRVLVYTDIYDPREYKCTACGRIFREKPAGSKEVRNG
jgi:hypothetical protein